MGMAFNLNLRDQVFNNNYLFGVARELPQEESWLSWPAGRFACRRFVFETSETSGGMLWRNV